MFKGLGTVRLNDLKHTRVDQVTHLSRLASMTSIVGREVYMRNVLRGADPYLNWKPTTKKKKENSE